MTKIARLGIEISSAYLSGETTISIASRYNVGFGTVYRLLEKCGVMRRRGQKLIGLEDEIALSYLAGRSSTELAIEYACSPPTILSTLKRKGIAIRCLSDANRVYDIDQTFFDVIDTENKAYVLGLWAADGNNNQKDGSITLSLTDYDTIKAVADAMRTNKPIYKQTLKVGKPYYTLALQSRHMSDILARNGCPQRKSLIMNFPSFEIVPEHLMHFYVLGYFDGDGCIHIRRKSKNKVVHIIGTKAFVSGIAELLPFKTFLNLRHKQKVWFLGIYRLADVHRFRDWLYENATLFMARKRDLFYQNHAAA